MTNWLKEVAGIPFSELSKYEPPFDGELKFQRLTTGHYAPYLDREIRAVNKLYQKFPHGPLLTERLISILRPDAVILDVGAFIGDNTLEFCSAGYRTIGIEPFRDSFVCAILNCLHPNACFINAAAGNGQLVRLEYSCHGDNHGMRSVRVNDGKGKTVPTLPIDELQLKECDFIKIDVEGFERQVLLGAAKTIKQFRPLLFVEANVDMLKLQGETTEALHQHILSLGYHTEPENLSPGNPPVWDWLAFPNDTY